MPSTEAQKQARKRYYEKNKSKINEQHRQYYYNNKESFLKTRKKYYEANREKLIEGMKRYYYNKKKIKINYEPKTIYFS